MLEGIKCLFIDKRNRYSLIPRILKINISYNYRCCFYYLSCSQSILFHVAYEDVCYHHLINFIHWISDVFKPRDPSCSLQFMGHSLKRLVYIHALAPLLEPWMLMTHFRFISVQPDNLFVPFLKWATTHHHPQSCLKWVCNFMFCWPCILVQLWVNDQLDAQLHYIIHLLL